jgi:ABC-type oligopeptide transport system substrate-binding subunit
MRRMLVLGMLTVAVASLALALAAAPAHAQTGGTFRVSLNQDIDYVDPALAYYVPSWGIEFVTCSMLMNYPDAPAPKGSRLIPEVAQGFPQISRDGKTYTFNLKRTYRFSNGQRIRAANFAAAINRDLNPKMNSPAQPFIDDIVGAPAVIAGRARTARGVRVLSPYRLQIRLSKRAPDLLHRLAMPFFCAIPTNLPIDPNGIQAPVVGSGPGYISRWEPKRAITVLRNRFYRGPRQMKVNRIEYDIGLPLETIRLNVESGVSDFAGDGLPPAAYAELGQKYGVRKSSPGQFFVNPSAAFRYLAMNHDRPLFGGGGVGNVRLKQAVNHAIDRIAMINQRGAYAGVINDQYMPPGMRGFRNAAIYPSRPNVARAQQLAQGNTRGGKGIFYCPQTEAPTCQVVQQNLQAIGLDMEIQLFPRAVFMEKIGTRGEPFDMALTGWHADYFDPYDFIDILLNGTNIRPANNVNYSYFNSPSYNRKIAAAAGLVGAARYRAFGNLDIDIARSAAPMASYITENSRILVSANTGCYFHHPIYTLDLAAICKLDGGSQPPPANQPPTASFTFSPNSPPSAPKFGQTISFAGMASDPDGLIASFRFNWGDGSSTTGMGVPSADHIYGAPNIFNPTLTVTDNGGASFTTPPQRVKVSGPGSKTDVWEDAPCPNGGSVTLTIDVYIPSYAQNPDHTITDPICPGTTQSVSAQRITGNAPGHRDEWGELKDTYRVTVVISGTATGPGSASTTVTWD